jgi:hypothetical protein
MARVKVTAEYLPDPEETDESDNTGLTQDAFEELANLLDEAGLTNVVISKTKD